MGYLILAENLKNKKFLKKHLILAQKFQIVDVKTLTKTLLKYLIITKLKLKTNDHLQKTFIFKQQKVKQKLNGTQF